MYKIESCKKSREEILKTLVEVEDKLFNASVQTGISKGVGSLEFSIDNEVWLAFDKFLQDLGMEEY